MRMRFKHRRASHESPHCASAEVMGKKPPPTTSSHDAAFTGDVVSDRRGKTQLFGSKCPTPG